MSHKCPGPHEEQAPDVADHMLMCAPCWYRVPKPIRNSVWRAWQGGAGAGTNEHRAAITAAIRSLGEHAP